MRRQTVTRQRKSAELLAVEALGFIAAEPERLDRFLALTGLAPDSARAAAQDPAFLAAVLDHIAGDESLLLAFAAQSGRAPTEVGHGRTVLSGPDWERDTA